MPKSVQELRNFDIDEFEVNFMLDLPLEDLRDMKQVEKWTNAALEAKVKRLVAKAMQDMEEKK